MGDDQGEAGRSRGDRAAIHCGPRAYVQSAARTLHTHLAQPGRALKAFDRRAKRAAHATINTHDEAVDSGDDVRPRITAVRPAGHLARCAAEPSDVRTRGL